METDLVDRIKAHHWFHTIDLGNGLVTNGHPPSRIIADAFPDVRGKSVIDIGAWDGKYSFEAERAGASRVVALDHYVWRLDPTARQAYYDECEAKGILPDPDMVDRGFLLDSLPGQAGFQMAHEYLTSKVETVVDDFATMDISSLGHFDVVLYFGVLYHMVDPIGALKRVRRVTSELAVIETAAVHVPGYESASLAGFFAGDELHADYGNWFAPTPTALVGMCRAAGFKHAELKASSLTEPVAATGWVNRRLKARGASAQGQPINTRIVVHAYT